MKRKFIVELEVPEHTNISDVKDYILTAVECECGSRHPEDPMFHLDRDSITVVHATRCKAAELLEELK